MSKISFRSKFDQKSYLVLLIFEVKNFESLSKNLGFAKKYKKIEIRSKNSDLQKNNLCFAFDPEHAFYSNMVYHAHDKHPEIHDAAVATAAGLA